MSDDDQTTLAGEVTDIFAHRFVVRTEAGKVPADLGPNGAEQIALREGDRVTLSGEMKPSEIKVRAISKDGGPTVVIQHKRPSADDPHDADPKHALETAEANGFAVVAGPTRWTRVMVRMPPKPAIWFEADATGRVTRLGWPGSATRPLPRKFMAVTAPGQPS
jgi:hypothetical protein